MTTAPFVGDFWFGTVDYIFQLNRTNYYTGSCYKQVAFPDEIYRSFGEQCDWNELNLEEKNTAYLVNY